MILKILLGLASVFAIYWAIKIKKIFPTIITLGMIMGIVMVFFPSAILNTNGFYVYMGFVALAAIYALTMVNLTIGARITIALMSVSIFLYWLWVLNHWHGNTILFPIFTLLVGAVAVISKVKLKNEIGFLFILGVDAIAIIIENWMKLN